MTIYLVSTGDGYLGQNADDEWEPGYAIQQAHVFNELGKAYAMASKYRWGRIITFEEVSR